MARVTKSLAAKARHKKFLKRLRDIMGQEVDYYKTAKQSNIKSLQYAFRDRKNKKRSFRSLWISRINAGSRNLGITYSRLIKGLTENNILLTEKFYLKLLSMMKIHLRR